MSTELLHRHEGKEERRGRRKRKKSAPFEVKPKKILGKKQRSLLSFDTFLRPRIHITAFASDCSGLLWFRELLRDLQRFLVCPGKKKLLKSITILMMANYFHSEI